MTVLETMGSVCDSITYGVTASADFTRTSGPKMLRITDITERGVDWGKVPRCSAGLFDPNLLLRDGDIVVARTGGTVGKSFLVSRPPVAVNASYLLQLRPNRAFITPDYLSLFLGSEAYWTQLRDAARGAAQPNVNATTLAEILLPRPSLPKQHEIVGRLKVQLAEVETALQAAQSQSQDSALLRSKVIEAAFAGFADWRPIGSVAKLQSGYAFKSESFKTSGVRLLRNANVLPGKVYWDDTAFLSNEDGERFPSYALVSGDVLISLDRPLISSGIKVARVGENDVPALLVQRVGRFLLNSEEVDAEYLYAFLQSARFIAEISGHEQSLGVPHISPTQVEAIELPLPSIAEQRSLSSRLKAQLAEVDAIQQAAAARLAEIRRMPQRLLAQAFNTKGDTP